MASATHETRVVKVAAAQLGAIQLADSRQSVIERMCTLLDEAATQNVQLVAFPELALTTFFPRWQYAVDSEQLCNYFEAEDSTVVCSIDQTPNVKALFDHAKSLGIDVYVGYAERSEKTSKEGTQLGYNSAVYYSASLGKVIAKYRKVHLPGTHEPYKEPGATQQLEKRYFIPGDLGFSAFRVAGLVKNPLKAEHVESASPSTTEGKGDAIIGMLICNDRRWPEAWRCYGLQGVEIVLCGFNTTAYAPELLGHEAGLSREEAEAGVLFSHHISCQGNSYMNSCFSVNIAKCGTEDGHDLISGTTIIAPSGKIIAEAETKGDELVVANLDLTQCRAGKEKMFAFEKHRRIEHYHRIVDQTGVIEPDLLRI